MDIEFDPKKDRINRKKHRGVSLADAAAFDLDSAVVIEDDRYDYGEVRYRAFGRVAGQGMCLVFTPRNNRVRVISYRRAHDEELAEHDL